VNASIERSAIMRTIRTSFLEDAVFLSLRFSSGEEVRVRIAPDNAAEGLWLSPSRKQSTTCTRCFDAGLPGGW